jgi:hypothetical protein
VSRQRDSAVQSRRKTLQSGAGTRGFSANLSSRPESRVPRSRQPSSEMDLITGAERSTSIIECQLRMKQDDCDYRGKLPGRMHVRRRGEYKAIVHLFCRT